MFHAVMAIGPFILRRHIALDCQYSDKLLCTAPSQHHSAGQGETCHAIKPSRKLPIFDIKLYVLF